MSNPLRLMQPLPAALTLAAALGLSACAGQDRGSAQGLRGYGTPGVTADTSGDQATSVQALLDRCARVPRQPGQASDDQGLAAACDQLHHTVHNQPGNAVPVPTL